MESLVSRDLIIACGDRFICHHSSKWNLFKVFLRNFIGLALAVSLLVLCALGVWSVKYRFPAGQAKIIDLRKSKTEERRYISFCASLANGNAIGFPGHAYLVWSPDADIDPERDYSLGFMPARFSAQIPSLVWDVEGTLLENVRGNTRNLDRLTVIVSADEYAKSKQYSAEFAKSKFKTGERDCVAYVNFIAAKLGMKTINPGFTFPQDYLRKLKELN